MNNQIFPKEILENTYEVHQFSHRKKSRILYGIILFVLTAALFSLPFISIDLYTSARGFLKPQQDRIQLVSPQQGQVVFSILHPHRSVMLGDTLLKLAHPVLNEQRILLNKQITEHRAFIKDLVTLGSQDQLINNLNTSEYKKQWILFKQGLFERIKRLEKLESDYQRDQKLWKKEVLSKNDYEESKLAYEIGLSVQKQWKQQYQNQWQSELQEYTNNLNQLNSNLGQLTSQLKHYVITANTTGTLLIPKGIENGSWVVAGQNLGELSPAGTLWVEVYVPSHKIGTLAPKTAVKFQIDAYNYNQWGVAHGRIHSVGKDIEFVNNQPVYKVYCSLDSSNLHLKNGVQAQLIKGLTLTAQFYQTRRSLFDLLYDDINDWMNPKQNRSL